MPLKLTDYYVTSYNIPAQHVWQSGQVLVRCYNDLVGG